MKLYPLLLVFLSIGTVLADPLARQAASIDTAKATPELRERRILITFHDQNIDRRVQGDPISSYRKRGEYDSSAWSQRITADLAEEYHLKPITEWPMTALGVHCVVYEVPLEQSLDETLTTLAKDKRIESSQRMNTFKVMGHVQHGDPYARLQTSIRDLQLQDAHRWATGKDVTIAVIDTGMDMDHPDLEGQITDKKDFVYETPSSFNEDIHGTAIAGVIAAISGNGKGIIGVAPDAKLIALRACWPEKTQSAMAVCDTLTLAEALNTAIGLRPQILNLSLTGPDDPLLTRLVAKALEAGIIVVAADAGNKDDNTGFPANMPKVIAVRTAGQNYKLSADNHVINWIPAPGAEVLTTLPHNTYNFMSGSSFAAAHVSGIIALLLELKPTLKSEEITQILQTAHYSDRDHKESVVKAVNACVAVAKLRAGTICSAVTHSGVESRNRTGNRIANL